MSEERSRKTNKPSTGTVPKIKHRNNFSTSAANDENPRSVSNNASIPGLVSQAGFWQQALYPTQFIRNTRKNTRNNYFMMDATMEEPTTSTLQNLPVNGVSSSASSSNSRRNSSNSTLKCDNVTKYPDKKQIEDKLHQIQEYLKVTNSLMANLKCNGSDQFDDVKDLEKMVNDLKDSEAKLLKILDHIDILEAEEDREHQNFENGIDNLSDHSSSSHKGNDQDINYDNQTDLETLKLQQMALMQLQRTAEKKLGDARQIQSNFLNSCGKEPSPVPNVKDSNSYSHFDKAIKELEEKAKQLRAVPGNQQVAQDNLIVKLGSLHDQIMSMRNANEEREELIQVLDNRDTELRTQHAELQDKLVELQNKKMQVDELVLQLQSFGEEEDEEMGGQVRKIVTMKDQLKKLKDMLEIVKTTENLMQNTNSSPEIQAAAFEICATTENYLDKEHQKPKIVCGQNEGNILRYDNDTSSESVPKQVNKNTRRQTGREGKPKTTSLNHKLAMQTELESKKRELEEIMGKHKASTSNLNHDVGIDNKSEFSCAGTWLPPQHQTDSDRFSSDECQDEISEFPEVCENHKVLLLSNLNGSPLNTSRREVTPQYVQHHEFERPHSMSRTPERNVRSSSVATSSCAREQQRSNNDQESKTQVHKQLQLIKSVCDSMLEQQSISQSNQTLQQLRNNLTPSPLYSEPRRHATPTLNAVNVSNPNVETQQWFPPYQVNNDLNNYNSWLTTNTIQTQSFMLNTLNQCCQMLWLQQRELVSLRNMVSMLQERMETQFPVVPQEHIPSPLQPPHHHHPTRSNHFRPQPKVNHHVSSAFSMPNLNQYNGTAPPSGGNADYVNHNNLHSNRLLDPCLNNVNINQHSAEHPTNNVLHGVNAAAINHTLPNQMWNGQALNNQVAPGNRANNYWDNFRSYSRQNLLSTKNSDPHHHHHPPSLDRLNPIDRPNPFSLLTFSKSNSEQDSTSTSQEHTPQRRSGVRHENVVIPPPDVLNINHNVSKENEQQQDLSTANASQQDNNEDLNLGLQMLLNLSAFNDDSSNHSNASEDHTVPEQFRRRNEWKEEVPDEQQQLPAKSKLFEELRENVYREVVSLISANESRPHFLIQLFRDLQMIGSDSLRLKILQSIQMIITHSLLNSNNSMRLSLGSQHASSEQDLSQMPDNLQSSVWSKPSKNSSVAAKIADLTEFENIFKGALPFLNEHDDDILQTALLNSLKQVLLNSSTFKETVNDPLFQKRFSNILDDVLEQFRGKKVCDVKLYLLQMISELLCAELGLIHFLQETNPEKCSAHPGNDLEHENTNYNTMNGAVASQVVDNIQNGDLAEADQTRLLDEDVEEEGAVGGILDGALQNMEITIDNQEEVDLSLNHIELACSAEGLDQIPTRLPTKVRSRSGTPSKDRSNSRTDPDPF